MIADGSGEVAQSVGVDVDSEYVVGAALTTTLYAVAFEAEQLPFVSVTLIEPVPAVVHVTVTTSLPCPAVMTPFVTDQLIVDPATRDAVILYWFPVEF